MKKSFTIAALCAVLVLMLTSCGSSPKVTVGTYYLNGDNTKPSIVIEEKDIIKFVGFEEDFFVTIFDAPLPGTDDYDDEDYRIMVNSASGHPIDYTTEIGSDGAINIRTKISEFIELKLPYDNEAKTITFNGDVYKLV